MDARRYWLRFSGKCNSVGRVFHVTSHQVDLFCRNPWSFFTTESQHLVSPNTWTSKWFLTPSRWFIWASTYLHSYVTIFRCYQRNMGNIPVYYQKHIEPFSNCWFNSICNSLRRVTHICVSKLIIIVSDNGLSPGRRQAIVWTNAGILSIGPLETNFSDKLDEFYIFSSRKCNWKYRLEIGGHFISASMC